MIKPKGLVLGDTMGIVAPAGPSTRKKVEMACRQLVDMGFRVKVGKSCYEKYGYLAGSDSLRAEDINSMFEDEEVDGIICLRGGYGTLRILDLLNYNMIANNPKVFIGYSDITALHIGLNRMTNLVTFHGPMAAPDIAGGLDCFSKSSLYSSIMKDGFDKGKLENPMGKGIEVINEGVAEGTIIGGNLSLIVSTLGTPYEIDLRGRLLFIEEIGEQPYRVDRLLNHLRLSGKLEEAKGIILGDFKNCNPRDGREDYSLSLNQVIMDVIAPIGKPCIANVQAGHCKPMLTIPFGVKARLDGCSRQLTIMEKPINR
ncbi:MAG TPA: LD-carboxypeptidase [Tepidimicrobium sp.]|nr:LD-carboxypeptidase [Tepidimicrobium sp.]